METKIFIINIGPHLLSQLRLKWQMTQVETRFANSVDFTRDSVEKITLRDENYPVDKRNFADKDIDI